jgi:hypothetical protein
MEKIKPDDYIRIQRKLCNPKVIIAANKIASEKGVTPAEACYNILNETLVKEYEKRKL